MAVSKIWVFAESDGDKPTSATLEILTKARELADQRGHELAQPGRIHVRKLIDRVHGLDRRQPDHAEPHVDQPEGQLTHRARLAKPMAKQLHKAGRKRIRETINHHPHTAMKLHILMSVKLHHLTTLQHKTPGQIMIRSGF